MDGLLRSARGMAMLVAVLAALCFVSGAAQAGDAGGRVPMPRIPKAQGEHCVADTDFMRRNHMYLLWHERDAALRHGLRRADYALPRCLTCHAVAGPDGKPVSYNDSRHFCRSCHDYAAVSVDCFECHSSLPDPAARAASQPLQGGDTAMLREYLRDTVR